jgi:hypothetical protein
MTGSVGGAGVAKKYERAPTAIAAIAASPSTMARTVRPDSTEVRMH